MTQPHSTLPRSPQNDSRKIIFGILGAALGLALGFTGFFGLSIYVISELNRGGNVTVLIFSVFLLIFGLVGLGVVLFLSKIRTKVSPVLFVFLLCLAVGIGVSGLGVGLCDFAVVVFW